MKRLGILVAALSIGSMLLLLIVALGSRGQTFVDGLPIGDRVDGDARFTDFALATLDRTTPGHAEVVTIEANVPDYRAPNGYRMLVTRSGGLDLIVVLRLADGAVRAFDVGCGAGIDTLRCYLGPPGYLSRPS